MLCTRAPATRWHVPASASLLLGGYSKLCWPPLSTALLTVVLHTNGVIMICLYYVTDGNGIQTASDATPAHLRLLLGGTLYTVVPGLSTRVCPSTYSRIQLC